MSCKKHPRYQAKRKPRVLCEGCWHFWFEAENDRRWRASKDYKVQKANEDYYRRNPAARAEQEWINTPG